MKENKQLEFFFFSLQPILIIGYMHFVNLPRAPAVCLTHPPLCGQPAVPVP
jgi:hypothetical protein